MALDIPVTIGTIKANAGSAHSDTYNGSNAFTLNNTGGTTANIFGNTNASIGITSSAGTLTINANIVAASAALDIGSTGNSLTTGTSTVVIGGNITASTTTTLNLRNNNPYTSSSSGNPHDQITGNIGATGSAINIVNASTGTAKTFWDISGAVGGTTGTGASVTIANTATGSTAFNFTGTLGATVSSITQNSTTSTMTLSGANTAAGGFGATGSTGTVTITSGTLQMGGTTALGAANTVTVASAGIFNLNGNSETIAGLNDVSGSGGSVTNTGAAATLTLGGAGTYSFAGIITATTPANMAVTKSGTGTQTLSGANTYTGATTVNAGILQAGVASVANTSGAFGNNSAVTMANVSGATLDLNNFNTQIGSLTGGGASGGNVTLGTATLTTGGDNTSPAAYAGVISGTGGVTKIGTGTQTLSGANTYSGGTTVSVGALTLTSVGTLGTGDVTLGTTNAVTLTLGSTNAAIGDSATLTFGTNSTIKMNASGTEILGAITDSSTSVTLNAANSFQSTYSASDLNTFFGVSSFSGTELFAVTAVPEPSTFVLGVLLVGVAGWSLRRRFASGESDQSVLRG